MEEIFKQKKVICPRCKSWEYCKFRYMNNKGRAKKMQPRYICYRCKKHFTLGGKLYNTSTLHVPPPSTPPPAPILLRKPYSCSRPHNYNINANSTLPPPWMTSYDIPNGYTLLHAHAEASSNCCCTVMGGGAGCNTFQRARGQVICCDMKPAALGFQSPFFGYYCSCGSVLKSCNNIMKAERHDDGLMSERHEGKWHEYDGLMSEMHEGKWHEYDGLMSERHEGKWHEYDGLMSERHEGKWHEYDGLMSERHEGKWHEYDGLMSERHEGKWHEYDGLMYWAQLHDDSRPGPGAEVVFPQQDAAMAPGNQLGINNMNSCPQLMFNNTEPACMKPQSTAGVFHETDLDIDFLWAESLAENTTNGISVGEELQHGEIAESSNNLCGAQGTELHSELDNLFPCNLEEENEWLMDIFQGQGQGMNNVNEGGSAVCGTEFEDDLKAWQGLMDLYDFQEDSNNTENLWMF